MNDQRSAALRRAALLGLALPALLSTGCLYMGETRRVEIEDDERIEIRFESAQAAQQFEAGFADSDQEAYTDRSAFALPFLAARGDYVYHETAHYNAAVRLADIDRDGTITESEARAYRDQIAEAAEGDE